MVGLGERAEETVRIYFEVSRRQFIRDALPQKARTVEEAAEDQRKSLLPSSR